VAVPDALLQLAIPALLPMLNAVEASFEECSSFKERKEKRMYMARGSIHTIMQNLSQAFRMLASRPVDPFNGKLKNNTPHRSIYDFIAMFRHVVFQSPAFHWLQEQVQAAQLAEE